MKLSRGQKKTLSLAWNQPRPPHEKAVEAFLAYTDRGISPGPAEAEEWWTDYIELWHTHKFLSVNVADWRQDFHEGLLFPLDFVEDRPALKELGLKIYVQEYSETWHLKICSVLRKRQDVLQVILHRYSRKPYPMM